MREVVDRRGVCPDRLQFELPDDCVVVQTPDADAHARGTLLHLAVDKPEQTDLIVRLWPVLLWDSLGLVRAVTDTANESDRTDSADTVRSRPPEQIMS